MELELFYALFAVLQLILFALGTWTLKAVNQQGNRLTKVETLLETSLISDIKDLKVRMREVETSCNHCKK